MSHYKVETVAVLPAVSLTVDSLVCWNICEHNYNRNWIKQCFHLIRLTNDAEWCKAKSLEQICFDMECKYETSGRVAHTQQNS